MGSLRRFALSDGFVQRFPHFVETGTNRGESLRYAARHNFKTLSSIEIDQHHYDSVTANGEWDDRVSILRASSIVGLKTIISRLPRDEGVLFWLDAHFPQGSTERHDIEEAKLAWPLRGELDLILALRPFGRDAILIDDWRIYSDMDCDKGRPDDDLVAPVSLRPPPLEALGEPHYFREDEGYQLRLPAGAPPLVPAWEWQ